MGHQNYEEWTLEDIVIALQNEFNEDLFNHLVVRLNPLLKSIAKHFKQPFLSAEDLYQESLIALLTAIDKYDSELNAYFIVFCRTTVKHHLLRMLRYFYAAKRGSGDSWREYLVVPHYTNNDGDTYTQIDFATSKEDDGEMQVMLNDLYYRFINVLAEEEANYINYLTIGLSNEEISKIMGITDRKAQYLRRRCRQKLDDLIRE